MEHLFDMRPDRPGYRLHRLEVTNWGTFDSTDGNVFRFEPQGRTSLLVGHNGSGKSTLVDAILTLLVDSRTRNYNVAAGANKTERTPKSYIKGAYNRSSDESQSSIVKYLRPKANHLTAISAVFRDEQLNSDFTLAQILHLKADGSDDKVFAIADKPHELKHDLMGLRKSNEVREHLKLKGYRTTRAYVEYQDWIAKLTKMRGKAIDMFNQTVAVKDIRSLNVFIRKHMLEAHDWRDKVQRLLAHFQDLSVAHQELVRARRSEELLIPVEIAGGKYRRQLEKVQQFKQELEAAKSFFPVQQIEIYKPELEEQQQNAKAMKIAIGRLDQDLEGIREKIRHLKNEIEQAGGERLKQIPGLIKIEEVHLQHKRDAFKQYHANLKTCRVKGVVGSPELLQKARTMLLTAAKSWDKETADTSQYFEDRIGRKASVDKQLRDEREELSVLERRRTNLPGRFAAMRSHICSNLNLDESTLPFAAELISVLPAEHRWEASVEMVLRPFALSLLVPERYYPRVRAYIERNRLVDANNKGQRLDYICVAKAAEPSGDRIDPRSLCKKLQFKSNHDLSPWVRNEILRRFDFRCCESVEEFNDISRFAMTENRHVKYNAQRYQKDDRDQTMNPRHFVLGWDNTEKKRRIMAHIQELESERDKLKESIASFGRKIEELRNIKRAAGDALAVTDFDSIDVKRHKEEITALQVEKKQLEESNEVVKATRKRLNKAESKEKHLVKDYENHFKKKVLLEGEIDRIQKELESARAAVQSQKDAGQFDLHQSMFDAITASMGEPALAFENFATRKLKWEVKTRQLIEDHEKPLQTLAAKLGNAMVKYLREFKKKQLIWVRRFNT